MQVPLKGIRDMRRIKGSYLEVMAEAFCQGRNKEDYLQITLTDEEDVPEGVARLRTNYPNLMQLSYDNRRTGENRYVEVAKDIENKSELALFEEFYEMQNNQPMGAEQKEFVRELIEILKETR